MKCLLKKNADFNAQDDRGNTPLHLATMNGNYYATYKLIQTPGIILDVR